MFMWKMGLMVMGGRKACILGNVKRCVSTETSGTPEVHALTILQIYEVL